MLSNDGSDRTGKVVVDGCWTVTLTRGVIETGFVDVKDFGFTLHLIT